MLESWRKVTPTSWRLCDVSCMTHINGMLCRQAQRCRAVHIAEVLNSQVDVDASPDIPAGRDDPTAAPLAGYSVIG